MLKIVYPGTFDPITYGHIDIIERGLRMFDQLIVAINANPGKQIFFSVEERVDLVKKALKKYKERIIVEPFKGLIVNYMTKRNINIILRGIRTTSDYEYEFQMALTNRHLCKNIETIFIVASEEYEFVSSSLLKEIALLGGDLKYFVPRVVENAIRKKIKAAKLRLD